MKKRVIGFSQIGPSHIRNKLPNQDSFLCHNSRNFSLIVVSDGLGSKKFSHIGAAAACKSVLKTSKEFVKNKDSTSVKEFFDMISKTWQSSLMGHKPEDCSATCLFALATKNKIFIARLGDGMVCSIGKTPDTDKLLFDNKNSTFSNETCSLSNTNLLSLWEYKSLPINDYKAVLISTDGISTDLQSGSEIEFSKDLVDTLNSKNYLGKKLVLSRLMRNWPVPKHSDDKTIAIMELS